jgi:hypothetical protein
VVLCGRLRRRVCKARAEAGGTHWLLLLASLSRIAGAHGLHAEKKGAARLPTRLRQRSYAPREVWKVVRRGRRSGSGARSGAAGGGG